MTCTKSFAFILVVIWSFISPIIAIEAPIFEAKPVSESELSGSREYDYENRKLRVENRVILSIEHLQSAFLQQEVESSYATLWVELTPDGRQRFAEFTKTLNGKGVAFFVQGKVLAAPSIYARVDASQIQISSLLEPNFANELVGDLKHAIRHHR